MPARLRRHLILYQHPGEPSLGVSFHRALHVHGVAVSIVAVAYYRKTRARGVVARSAHINHLPVRNQPRVRERETRRRHAEPGHECGVETGALDQSRAERVVRTGRLNDFGRLEKVTQHVTLRRRAGRARGVTSRAMTPVVVRRAHVPADAGGHGRRTVSGASVWSRLGTRERKKRTTASFDSSQCSRLALCLPRDTWTKRKTFVHVASIVSGDVIDGESRRAARCELSKAVSGPGEDSTCHARRQANRARVYRRRHTYIPVSKWTGSSLVPMSRSRPSSTFPRNLAAETANRAI